MIQVSDQTMREVFACIRYIDDMASVLRGVAILAADGDKFVLNQDWLKGIVDYAKKVEIKLVMTGLLDAFEKSEVDYVGEN